MVIEAAFITDKSGNNLHVYQLIKRIHKMFIIIYNGILFSNKKNEVLINATVWTNLKNIMLIKTCQTSVTQFRILPACPE